MSEILRDSVIRLGTFFVAPGLINGRTELEIFLSRIGATMCRSSKRAPNAHYGQGMVLFYWGAKEALKEDWEEAFWAFSAAAGHFEDGAATVEYDVAWGLRALALLINEREDIALPTCQSIEDMEAWAESYLYGDPDKPQSVLREARAIGRMLLHLAAYWKASRADRLPFCLREDMDEYETADPYLLPQPVVEEEEAA